MTESVELAVIGGGPAGAAAAAALATAGREVVLIERGSDPRDKVCGEFLSHEALHYLARLGLDLRPMGTVTIDRILLAIGNRSCVRDLPFAARGLSRMRLDEALLACAEERGATLLRGSRVVSLTGVPDGWRIGLQNGQAVAARTVFLATGKHDLRNWHRPEGLQPDLVAFKQHWRLAPAERRALDGAVELHTFPGGYAGLQASDAVSANLCLVIRQNQLRRWGTAWPTVLEAIRTHAPRLARRLDGGTPIEDKPLALSHIPYGHVERRRDGIWRLGDQAVVIPSLTGTGISIALHSGRLAAECYLAGLDAGQYHAALARHVGRAVRTSMLVSRLLVSPMGQSALRLAVPFARPALGALARATRVGLEPFGAMLLPQ